MSSLSLPVHPSRRHPLTGEPIRALWVTPAGRVCWPIIGAAEDDGGGAGGAGGAGGDGDKGGTGGAAGGKTDPPPFPANTPLLEMTAEQQAAYWKHHARKHEGRAEELLTVTGGKTAEQIKKDAEELETLRAKGRTEQENAVVEAARKASTDTAATYGEKAAKAVFTLALSHVEDAAEKAEILSAIDMKSVIKEDGEIDTDKVQRLVKRFAPQADTAGDSKSRERNFGGGPRSNGGNQSSGVSAGRAAYQERHGKKSTA